jgi:hypothetical protein
MSFVGDIGYIIEAQAIEMHVLTSQQGNASIEIRRCSTGWCDAAADLRYVVFDPVNGPHHLRCEF